MRDAPFDRGLQLERTLLAWRRTALALGLSSLLALRFTSEQFGVVAIIVGIVGVLLAAAAYLASTRRYRRIHAGLTGSGALSTGGASAAFTAAIVILTGIASLGYVIGRGLVP